MRLAGLAATVAALAVASAVSAAGAEAGAAEGLTDAVIPEHIVDVGTELVRARAGVEFTDTHVRYDPSASRRRLAPDRDLTRYLLEYRILIPEQGVDELVISVTLDVQDGLITETRVGGVPECLQQPLDCEITVPRTEAVAIATRDSLGGSPEYWNVALLWKHQHGFVWYVEWARPLGLDSQLVDHRTIDADTGEVVRRSGPGLQIRFISRG
jgi:hypothetical protein